MPAQQIAMALRQGSSISDAAFDVLLSRQARLMSRRFWTPVDVARRAAEWLESSGVDKVLDVGSGAGKFCVVAALSTRVTFVGVEQRASLASEAAALAARLDVGHRAIFTNEQLSDRLGDDYDGIYAFNPFAENLFHPTERYEPDVSMNVERYTRELQLFERLMARLPVGFRVVTYHGCGARIPDSFELTRSEHAGTNVLRLWTKSRRQGRGGFWRERFATTDLCAPDGAAVLTIPRSAFRTPDPPEG